MPWAGSPARDGSGRRWRTADDRAGLLHPGLSPDALRRDLQAGATASMSTSDQPAICATDVTPAARSRASMAGPMPLIEVKAGPGLLGRACGRAAIAALVGPSGRLRPSQGRQPPSARARSRTLAAATLEALVARARFAWRSALRLARVCCLALRRPNSTAPAAATAPAASSTTRPIIVSPPRPAAPPSPALGVHDLLVRLAAARLAAGGSARLGSAGQPSATMYWH